MFTAFLRRCARQYPYYRDIAFEEMIEWHEPHFTHYRHTEIMDDMLWHVCYFGDINDLVGEVYKNGKWLFEYRMVRVKLVTDDYIVIYIRNNYDVAAEHFVRAVPVSQYKKGVHGLTYGF